MSGTDSRDPSTEEKIKAAAHVVFAKKGYAATRTRDIAQEAGINLALLSYYFRSKQNLFSIIMLENMQAMIGLMIKIVNDADTTLMQKVEQAVGSYFEAIRRNPDLPMFVLSEIRNNPELIGTRLPLKQVIQESVFARQIASYAPGIDPVQMIMNMMSMIVFPFITKPLFVGAGQISEKQFATLLDTRQALIPAWFEACLKVS